MISIKGLLEDEQGLRMGELLTVMLTQNVHPAPNTQQAEQSWLHTREE
jgi:hypothetical protein